MKEFNNQSASIQDLITIAKQLIVNGKSIDAIKKVKENFLENLSIVNYLSALESQSNKIESMFNLGIINFEEYNLNNNKINYALLNTIQKIGENDISYFQIASKDFIDIQNLINKINIKIENLNNQWNSRSFLKKSTSYIPPNIIIAIGIFYFLNGLITLSTISSISSSPFNGPSFENHQQNFQETVSSIYSYAILNIIIITGIFLTIGFVLRNMIKQNIDFKEDLDSKKEQLLRQLE
jgi:hypothetical protein